MRILVLGGTAFVGRAVVEDALRHGAEVTLFGRGRTGTDLFPDIPRRIGDRDTGDYASLRDGRWGAVVDVSGYVPRHAARGGRVALPGRPEQPVQVVDSRDLARLVVRLLVDDRTWAYNAVGPASPTTMGSLIATCAEVAGSEVEVVPVPPSAIPSGLPLVRPEAMWPTQQRSAARARTAGMPATPLAVTVGDVLAWDRERGEPPLERGLSPEDEAEVLAGARQSTVDG